MADGFTLIVPKEMVERLAVADEKIAKLADTAEKSTTRINQAFNNIVVNGGLDAFIRKLNEANQTLNGMAGNISGLKDVADAFKNINNVANKTNGASPVNTTAIQESIDKINELVASLANLKELNKISLQTQQEGVNYAQQANAVKELANAEAERARILNREDVAREKNNKNEQSLATQRLVNDTKELLNVELDRKQRLSVDAANIKNYYAQQSLEAKRVANDVKQAMYAEQERTRQMQLQNQQNIAAYKLQSAELKRQIAETERLARAYKEMPTSFSWADLSQHLDASKNATSINQRITAIHNLKSALKDLDTTDANYKNNAKLLNEEIKRQEKELSKLGVKVDEVNKKKTNLMNLSGQIQRKLALLFSATAIQGYIGKLAKVRGEFEMQNKALEVLLQNKDKANELWDQTIKLAVKSPFTVKELVTYTKQLAAYRIESDKLFQTNKMLADVSAGLGVDMQRLILAFGQVKAANFLRGTELRQFSEAGVNMLGELAKMYSEVEGKMVSVGDVFERVSKRAVSFEDVEKVFERITSVGGVFYNMQEEQSKTLQGMWRNLTDSIDLMMNDIGMSYDSTLKGMVSATRMLVENWRIIAPIIKMIAAMLTINILHKGLRTIIASVSALIKPFKVLVFELTLAKAAGLGLKATLQGISATGLGAILSVIGLIAGAIWAAAGASSKLHEELDRINIDLGTRLDDGIEKYRELADVVNNATKSEYDRNKALEEMKRIFGDILPDEMLRRDVIESYAGNYEKAEKAMRNYYDAEWAKQSEAKIRSTFGEDLDEKSKDIKKHLRNSLDYTQDPEFAYNISPEEIKRIKDRYLQVLNSVKRDVENGKIGATAEEMTEAFVKKLSLVTDVDKIAITQIFNKEGLRNAFEDYAETAQEMIDEIYAVQPLSEKGWTETKMKEQANAIQKQVEVVQKAYATIANLAKQKAEGKVYWGDILPNINEELTKVKETAPQYYDVLVKFYRKLEQYANEGTFRFNSELNLLSDGFNTALANMIIASNKTNTVAKNFAENLKKALDADQLTDQGKAIVQIMYDVANSMNLDPDIFARFIPTASKSLGDIRKMLEEEQKSIDEQIRHIQTSMQNGVSVLLMKLLYGIQGKDVDEEIANLKKKAEAIKEVIDKLGGPTKTPKTKKTRNKSDSDSEASDLVDLLEKMHDKYIDLTDLFSTGKAKAKVLEHFKNSFEEIAGKVKNFNISLSEFNFTSIDGLAKALKRVQSITRDKRLQSEIEDIISTKNIEAEAEKIKKQNKERERTVELLFEEYDAYKELSKMGVEDKDLNILFGINTLSLESLRDSVNNIFKDVDLGNEQYEAYQEFLKKIDELEVKEQENRLKEYLKYLKKAQSERVKLKVKELQMLADIEDSFQISEAAAKSGSIGMTDEQWKSFKELGVEMDAVTDAQWESIGLTKMQIKAIKEYIVELSAAKDLAITGVRDETRQNLDKAEWEVFKDSAMYEKIFADVETLGTKTIDALITRLKGMKETLKDLPVEFQKEIEKAIQKLDTEKTTRNPFAAWIKAFKSYNDRGLKIDNEYGTGGKNIRNEKGVQEYINLQEIEIGNANKEIEILSQVKEAQGDINKLKEVGVTLTSEQQLFTKLTDAQINSQIGKLKEQITKRRGNVDLAKKELEKYEEMRGKMQAAEEGVNGWKDALIGVLDGVDMLLDAFGVAEDSQSRIWIEMTKGIIESVAQMVLLTLQAHIMGVAMNSALGIIGWIATALQAVALLLSAVFSAHDKDLQNQIKDAQKEVEKLEKELENLEERLEAVYSLGGVNKSMRQVQANIDKQIQSYEKMMRLEEEKKNADEDQIEEWKENIEELQEKRKELHKEMVESLGGNYDVRSVAREFVDAWIDAFKETGDGLKGLRDNFKDFFLNILLEQAVMQKVGGLFSDAMDYLNNTVLSDYIVTDAERKKTEGMFDEAMIKTNDYLNLLFGENGVLNKYIDDTDSSLSGLQQGIQGVTEETAQIIEAYLNSIRFYIAQDNQNLAKLVDTFTNVESPNPILSELRTQTELITSIRDLFRDVVRMGHPTYGGAFLKVAL